MSLGPESLARVSARHPWRTIIVWILLVVVAGALSSALLSDALTTEVSFTNDPESQRAEELVEERLTGPERDTEIVIVTSDVTSAQDPQYRDYVGRLERAIDGLGNDVVRSVASYLKGTGPVSADGSTALVLVELTNTDTDDAADDAVELNDVVRTIDPPESIRTFLAGPATLANDLNDIVEQDIRKGESFGILAALVILVLVLGAVLASTIPLVVAVCSIAVAFGAASLVGLAFDLSFLTTSMITFIGLAVGTDYSLFIVSRFREERRHGRDTLEAIARSAATASRAVLFSGVTVVLALLGMLIVPNTTFRSLGIGAILVVVTAVFASLTLLPAVLSLLGDRINALRVRRSAGDEPGQPGGFWDRISNGVMRRPVFSLVVAGGALIAATLGFFRIETGFAGVSTVPEDIQSRQAFTVLFEKFSGGLAQPTKVVIDGPIDDPEVRAGFDELTGLLRKDAAFGPDAPPQVNRSRDLTLLVVPLRSDPQGDEALEAIRRLRGDYIPRAFTGANADVLVGGETATNVDFADQSDAYMPFVFAFVLGLSFILLMIVFRSLVVPAKAMVMNLLSVGAAYGLLVIFFQENTGPAFVKTIAGWLNFGQVEAIEPWLPLLMFSSLFGLSMDYQVFLLSRIRERFDQTHDNTESVAYGLRTTGGLITGAALIMVAVWAGFAAGRLVALQQTGFGLAVAVLLDATIIRSVLVPASMKLLGDRNWYLPGWLAWLPRLSVESPPVVAQPSATPPRKRAAPRKATEATSTKPKAPARKSKPTKTSR